MELKTNCNGNQTASTTASIPVVVFGADAHSPATGASGTVSWSLTDDPIYKSGYNATARKYREQLRGQWGKTLLSARS